MASVRRKFKSANTLMVFFCVRSGVHFHVADPSHVNYTPSTSFQVANNSHHLRLPPPLTTNAIFQWVLLYGVHTTSTIFLLLNFMCTCWRLVRNAIMIICCNTCDVCVCTNIGSNLFTLYGGATTFTTMRGKRTQTRTKTKP